MSVQEQSSALLWEEIAKDLVAHTSRPSIEELEEAVQEKTGQTLQKLLG